MILPKTFTTEPESFLSKACKNELEIRIIFFPKRVCRILSTAVLVHSMPNTLLQVLVWFLVSGIGGSWTVGWVCDACEHPQGMQPLLPLCALKGAPQRWGALSHWAALLGGKFALHPINPAKVCWISSLCSHVRSEFFLRTAQVQTFQWLSFLCLKPSAGLWDFENTEVTEWHKGAVLEGKTEFNKCNLLKFWIMLNFFLYFLFLAWWIRTAKDSK